MLRMTDRWLLMARPHQAILLGVLATHTTGKRLLAKSDLVMTEGRSTFRRYGLQETGTALRWALILTCGYPLALQYQPFCGRSCMFSSDHVHLTLQ